jgi:hypothetical protein
MANDNWDKLSLFNERSWIDATVASRTIGSNSVYKAAGHSVIRISPNFYYYNKNRNKLATVFGVTKKNVEFGISSQWDARGHAKLFSGFIDGASSISEMAESGELGALYSSKKLWKKSGYLDISPEFRIVDWGGNGQPIRSALNIIKYCLPGIRDNDLGKSISDAKQWITQHQAEIVALTKETAHNVVNGTANLAEKIVDNPTASSIIDTSKNFANGIIDEATDKAFTFSDNIFDDLHDYFTLKDAPPPVMIQIGQYFYHPDMVIDDVNFEFSKEVTRYGPMFVDIRIKASSRKIMNGIEDTGLLFPTDLAGRVTIQQNAATQQNANIKGTATQINNDVKDQYDKVIKTYQDSTSFVGKSLSNGWKITNGGTGIQF